jgi:4-amino-4-deoxy-L-arabinose transferase-like glycosyltransferase
MKLDEGFVGHGPGPASRRRFLDRHAAFIIFVAGLFLLAPCIWCETSITGQDEYWLSFRTPMETLEKGDWFTPWVNGEPRLKKPPLLYWLMMVSYQLLGINLFAARIWGVLAGAGLAACSTLLYRELFRKSGLLAGLIILGTISVAIDGRRAMLDLPLAFFTALAVFFAVKWGRSARPGWIAAAALSLGLSFLVKGPVGIILFSVAAGSALFVFNRWNFFVSNWRQVLWACILLLAVALPWPVIMACLWPDFLAIVDSEVTARGIGTVHVKSPFSTVGGALGLVFPWSLILLAALMRAVYREKGGWDRKGLWLAAWFLGCVIPFFFIRSFTRYMTPLIPAAAVLCAYWLNQASGPWRHALLKISMSLMALVSVVFCIFFIWFGQGVFMAAVCLAMAGVLLWLTFTDRDIRLTAGSVAVLFSLMMGGLYPYLGINALPQGLDAIVGSKPVAAFNSSQPSMLSMRLQQSAVQVRSFVEEELQELREFDGFVFVREADAGAFEALAEELGIHAVISGRFKTFYSRQAWIRFAREDVTAADWKEAAVGRSLEVLKPTICYYRVRPQSPNS